MRVPKREEAWCLAEIWKEIESWQQRCRSLRMNCAAQLRVSGERTELEKVWGVGGKGKAQKILTHVAELKMWAKPPRLYAVRPFGTAVGAEWAQVMNLHLSAAPRVRPDPSVSRARSCSTSEFCSGYQQGFFTFTSSGKVPPLSPAQCRCQIQHSCPAWTRVGSCPLIPERERPPDWLQPALAVVFHQSNSAKF